jgi:hypothetical protein
MRCRNEKRQHVRSRQPGQIYAKCKTAQTGPLCRCPFLLVEQRRVEPLTSALRIRRSAKRKCLPFPRLQPPKKIRGFFTFFRFLTIAYTWCAEFFGQILASWNPKTLGCFVCECPPSWPISNIRSSSLNPSLTSPNTNHRCELRTIEEGSGSLVGSS